ncbi:hypothetical protein LTR56_023745 [Elasticomyces elasticus]|nr:hypothetical protein LTR56_023745 [Elasticomyces elasticus]
MSVLSFVAGKIGHVMAAYGYWESESPDLKKYRQVMEEVVIDIHYASGHDLIGRHGLQSSEMEDSERSTVPLSVLDTVELIL